MADVVEVGVGVVGEADSDGFGDAVDLDVPDAGQGVGEQVALREDVFAGLWIAPTTTTPTARPWESRSPRTDLMRRSRPGRSPSRSAWPARPRSAQPAAHRLRRCARLLASELGLGYKEVGGWARSRYG